MIALACLLGITAIVWLLIKEAADEQDNYYGYQDVVDESDWRDWDYPIPDDGEPWPFERGVYDQERDAA